MTTLSARARNVQINIRVTPEEFETIQKLAKSYGLQLSEYMRFLLLQQRRKQAQGKAA